MNTCKIVGIMKEYICKLIQKRFSTLNFSLTILEWFKHNNKLHALFR